MNNYTEIENEGNAVKITYQGMFSQLKTRMDGEGAQKQLIIKLTQNQPVKAETIDDTTYITITGEFEIEEFLNLIKLVLENKI